MKFYQKIHLLFFIAALFLASCTPDDVSPRTNLTPAPNLGANNEGTVGGEHPTPSPECTNRDTFQFRTTAGTYDDPRWPEPYGQLQITNDPFFFFVLLDGGRNWLIDNTSSWIGSDPNAVPMNGNTPDWTQFPLNDSIQPLAGRVGVLISRNRGSVGCGNWIVTTAELVRLSGFFGGIDESSRTRIWANGTAQVGDAWAYEHCYVDCGATECTEIVPCECNGGVAEVTFTLAPGIAGPVTIKVNKGNTTYLTFNNVLAGQELTIIPRPGKDKLENPTVEVLGFGEVDLHSSCSEYLVGNQGPIDVLSQTDRDGNVCDECTKDPKADDDCCKGGIAQITFELNAGPYDVNVLDDNGAVIANYPALAANQPTTVIASGLKFDKNLTFEIVGLSSTGVHTSCSKDIIGDFGDFTILSHVDKNGGLCEDDGDGPDLPGNSSSGSDDDCCKGGIAQITFELNAGPYDVNVLDDNGAVIANYPALAANQPTTVIASGIKFDKNITFEIVGLSSTGIHTSCSKDIIGDFGDFTILSHVDKNGGLCEDDGDGPDLPSNSGSGSSSGSDDDCCKGGIAQITFELNAGPYDVNVLDDNGSTIASYSNLGANQPTTVIASGLKFDKNLTFEIVGLSSTDIHTSCSKDIIGDFGDFTILSHVDKNGALCEDDGDGPDLPSNSGSGSSSGSDDDCCKGGIAQITFELNAGPYDVNVLDDNGSTIASYSNLGANQPTTVIASGLKFDKNLTFEIVGLSNTDIHTSCSKDIIGDFGDFTILSHVDKNGALCEDDGDGPDLPSKSSSKSSSGSSSKPDDDCCNGGIAQMNIRLGNNISGPVTINVYKGNTLYDTFQNVVANNVITVVPRPGKDKLENPTIEVVGNGSVQLHTSCSQDILGVQGPIIVISHIDRNGSVCD